MVMTEGWFMIVLPTLYLYPPFSIHGGRFDPLCESKVNRIFSTTSRTNGFDMFLVTSIYWNFKICHSNVQQVELQQLWIYSYTISMCVLSLSLYFFETTKTIPNEICVKRSKQSLASPKRLVHNLWLLYLCSIPVPKLWRHLKWWSQV
jgi:ABC-type antimicrobial peptide transport system permease subunit